MNLDAIRRLLLRLRRRTKIMYIGGSDVLPPPLEREAEAEALALLEQGDRGARRLLIEHNLRLVVFIARRFESTGVNLEDLISIGTIGLIKGINTFRRDRNIKLATYASRCVENEILMHIRKIANQKTEISLDEPINTDWDGNELLLSDILGTDGDTVLRALEDSVDHELLRAALARVPDTYCPQPELLDSLQVQPQAQQDMVRQGRGRHLKVALMVHITSQTAVLITDRIHREKTENKRTTNLSP